MTPKKRSAVILIIGDTTTFGRAISAIIGGSTTVHHIRCTTYDQLQGILTPRLIRKTDLFVLELWRTYATGLRAEGLAVSEELSKQRAKALVVSPFCWGKDVDISWYWDLASRDALAQRCERVLHERVPNSGVGAEQLRRWLAGYLTRLEGHAEEPPLNKV